VSDFEAAQRRRNIVVGIFVLAALVGLGFMVYKFGELPTAISKLGSYHVKVQFPTAKGVQKDTPVRFCGYQVGRVTQVEPPMILRDQNTGRWYYQTIVVLSIDRQYGQIPRDVEPKLMTRGLGSSYIELKQTTTFDVNKPTGPFLADNDTLQGSTGTTSEFFPEESQKKLEHLVDGLSSLVNNFNDIVGDPKNKQYINRTIANLADVSQEAAVTLRHIRETLDQADITLQQYRRLAVVGANTLQNADERIDSFVTAFAETGEQLSKAASELRITLQKINNGEGTAARFLNDGRLYEELLESAHQLEELVAELKAFTARASEKGVPIKLK